MVAVSLRFYVQVKARGANHDDPEHIQRLLTKSQDVTTNTIQHYKMLLRVIFDNTPIIPQTSKSIDRRTVTSLMPNYLCLQCPTTITARGRSKHGKLKAHMFCRMIVWLGLIDLLTPSRCGLEEWRALLSDV